MGRRSRAKAANATVRFTVFVAMLRALKRRYEMNCRILAFAQRLWLEASR